MAEILAEIYSWISFVPKITFKNLIEIAIIAILVYEMLIWIKNTRAWTLLKGIVFILAFFLAAAILELDTILWLLEKTSYIAVTAIIVIFQPELRKALEQIGSQNVLTLRLRRLQKLQRGSFLIYSLLLLPIKAGFWKIDLT